MRTNDPLVKLPATLDVSPSVAVIPASDQRDHMARRIPAATVRSRGERPRTDAVILMKEARAVMNSDPLPGEDAQDAAFERF